MIYFEKTNLLYHLEFIISLFDQLFDQLFKNFLLLNTIENL